MKLDFGHAASLMGIYDWEAPVVLGLAPWQTADELREELANFRETPIFPRYSVPALLQWGTVTGSPVGDVCGRVSGFGNRWANCSMFLPPDTIILAREKTRYDTAPQMPFDAARAFHILSCFPEVARVVVAVMDKEGDIVSYAIDRDEVLIQMVCDAVNAFWREVQEARRATSMEAK